jgi:hypothetical protein
MPPYCTKADALSWVTQGSVTNPRRAIAAVHTDTDTLAADDHRLATGSEVQLWLPRNGAGEMAEPLVEGAVYYAIRLSDSTFQVAATPADAAAASPVNITSEGCNMKLGAQIPWDAYIEGRSAKLDEQAIGNAFPLADGEPIPIVVRDLVSIQVLGDAARFVGKTDIDLSEEQERARKELEIWATGKPLRAKEAPAPTNTAVSGPRLSGSAADPRGWSRSNSCGRQVIP